MTDLTIEMLDPVQVDAQWDELEPLLEASCKSNEVGAMDICPDDIRRLATAGMCVVFACREEGELKLVAVFQFHDTNGHKGADLIALSGTRLLTFKSAYWNLVLDWLKANGCEFLDAYANERLAKVYKNKFGFDRSCVMVRMAL